MSKSYSPAAIRTVARLISEAEAPLMEPDTEADAIPSAEEQQQAAAQLTPEQAKLVADNQGLLHTFAHQFSNIEGLEYDDVFSAAQWFMIKSALKYDPEKMGSRGNAVPFGAFAARNIRLNLKDLYNKQTKYNQRNEFTLDGQDTMDGEAENPDDEGGDGFLAHDQKTPTADQDVIAREKRALLQSLIDQMRDPLDKEIIQTMLDGAEETNADIGKRHGVVPTAIGNRRSRALAGLRQKLQKLGIGPNESLDDILEPVPSAAVIREMLDAAGVMTLRKATKAVTESKK